MKKFLLTMVAGLIGGQLLLLIVSFSPNAIWDIDSHVAMLIAGPIISFFTVYGTCIYSAFIRERG